MNPDMLKLQPYPFQRLADLFKGVKPNPEYAPINLSIGEPKHPTPTLISDALVANLAGLSAYPTSAGRRDLRESIANWLTRRYNIPLLNAEAAILPVTGSREALFSFAQVVVDRTQPAPVVICPNPFYQIYEGAALLAGAEPYFLNTVPENDYAMDFDSIPADVWQRAQLIYLCSPGNPTGKVMDLEQWRRIFELADRYNVVIAADECYSEIYFDEARRPLGALQAAHLLGRDHRNLVVFSSLSKRSNVPGMRSGFVAGDEYLIGKFLLYRTYHGTAMNPAVQAASIAAWNDDSHVRENRRQYVEKFSRVTPLLQTAAPDKLQVSMPDAAFYLWANTSQPDADVALGLYRDFNVIVLPGSYLARAAHGINPGENFIRIALVASLEECMEATKRITQYLKNN